TFAGALATPLEDHTGKHVFQTFGIDDTYSPPATMGTFMVAARLEQIEPHSSADPVYEEDMPKGTVPPGYAAEVGDFTLGMRQYGPPSGRDGHFVVFDVQAANDDMVR